MGRKRSIHTDITSDGKMEILAEEFGPLHCLVYTWAIPHAEDDGRLDADPRRFRNTVLAALKTVVTLEQVRQIIADIATVADESGRALWTLEKGSDGRTFICFPRDAWFRHQSYIPKAKRGEDAAPSEPMAPASVDTDVSPTNSDNSNLNRETPKSGGTAEERREFAVPPQNPSSPSLSPPLSPTDVNTSVDINPTLSAEPDGAVEEDGGEDEEDGLMLTPPEGPPPPGTVKRASKWPWLSCVPRKVAPHADHFERWYAAYPRKVAPVKAWSAWQKRIVPDWSDDLGNAVFGALEVQKRSQQWRDPELIPHPSTWLNERRWENEDAADMPPSPAEPSQHRPVDFSATDPLRDRLEARRARQRESAASGSGGSHPSSGRLPA